MTTNFQKVQEFNRVMGVETLDKPDENLFNKQEMITLRLSLIAEEFAELSDAIKKKDQVEVLDAIGDLLYVTYGAADAFGYDVDEAFRRIHESNMSKVCETEQIAKDTVEWYKQEYAANKLPYNEPTYRKDPSGKYYVVYNKSTGKILKSLDWEIVDLHDLTDTTTTSSS